MFVDRARVIGSGPGHIMRRHIFPNVVNLIVAQAVITFAAAVFIETSLSFIGLGDPFAPSWGQLLDAAQEAGAPGLGAWWYIAPPAVCVVLVVLAVHARRQRPRRHPQPEVGGPPMTDPRDELELAGELAETSRASRTSRRLASRRRRRGGPRRRGRDARRAATPVDAGAAARWPSVVDASGRCRSRPIPGAPLLVVEDLRTHFKLESGWVKAVDGVSFRLNDGEALGLAGRVGLRQDDDRAVARPAAARRTPGSARAAAIELFGIDLVPKTEDQLRRYRWREISIVFQGAMNALNPVRRIGEQIAEPIEIRLRRAEGPGPQAGGRAARARRHPAQARRPPIRTSCRAGCASGR